MPSIDTQTLATVLGMPLNSKPIEILNEIGQLLAFKNNHSLCRDNLR